MKLKWMLTFAVLALNASLLTAQEKVKQTAGRDQLGTFAPQFAALNDDVLFGEVWSRTDKLGLRDRSLVTITSLISQGIIDSSLIYHLQSARQNGITRTDYFTGNSYLAPISKEQVAVSNVTFEPGCRNHWHIHRARKGGGQMLIGVAGQGWYQEEGKPAVKILPGTVIHIPANVKHWHGAAADSWFAHLAFEIAGEGTSNEWLEPVTDEIYSHLK